jgi:hypothetical protein
MVANSLGAAGVTNKKEALGPPAPKQGSHTKAILDLAKGKKPVIPQQQPQPAGPVPKTLPDVRGGFDPNAMFDLNKNPYDSVPPEFAGQKGPVKLRLDLPVSGVSVIADFPRAPTMQEIADAGDKIDANIALENDMIHPLISEQVAGLSFDPVELYNASINRASWVKKKGGETVMSKQQAQQQLAKLLRIADYRQLNNLQGPEFKKLRLLVPSLGSTPDSQEANMRDGGVNEGEKGIIRRNPGIGLDSGLDTYARALNTVLSPSEAISLAAGDPRTQEEIQQSNVSVLGMNVNEGGARAIFDVGANILGAMATGGASAALSGGAKVAGQAAGKSLARQAVEQALFNTGVNIAQTVPGAMTGARDIQATTGKKYGQALRESVQQQFEGLVRQFDPSTIFDPNVPMGERVGAALNLAFLGAGAMGKGHDVASGLFKSDINKHWNAVRRSPEEARALAQEIVASVRNAEEAASGGVTPESQALRQLEEHLADPASVLDVQNAAQRAHLKSAGILPDKPLAPDPIPSIDAMVAKMASDEPGAPAFKQLEQYTPQSAALENAIMTRREAFDPASPDYDARLVESAFMHIENRKPESPEELKGFVQDIEDIRRSLDESRRRDEWRSEETEPVLHMREQVLEMLGRKKDVKGNRVATAGGQSLVPIRKGKDGYWKGQGRPESFYSLQEASPEVRSAILSFAEQWGDTEASYVSPAKFAEWKSAGRPNNLPGFRPLKASEVMVKEGEGREYVRGRVLSKFAEHLGAQLRNADNLRRQLNRKFTDNDLNKAVEHYLGKGDPVAKTNKQSANLPGDEATKRTSAKPKSNIGKMVAGNVEEVTRPDGSKAAVILGEKAKQSLVEARREYAEALSKSKAYRNFGSIDAKRKSEGKPPLTSEDRNRMARESVVMERDAQAAYHRARLAATEMDGNIDVTDAPAAKPKLTAKEKAERKGAVQAAQVKMAEFDKAHGIKQVAKDAFGDPGTGSEFGSDVSARTPASRDAMKAKYRNLVKEDETRYNGGEANDGPKLTVENTSPERAAIASERFRLVVSRRGSVLATKFAKEWRRGNAIDLVGQEVRSAEDLAVIAQCLRDPGVETVRWVMLKKGKIQAIESLSMRLPGHAAISTDPDLNAYVSRLLDNSGADEVYVMHNHPSGDPVASREDILTTTSIEEVVNDLGVKFGGHVIINTTKYNFLDPENLTEGGWYQDSVHDVPGGESHFGDQSDVPSVIGKEARDPESVAVLAANYKRPGFVTLVSLDSKANVNHIFELPGKEYADMSHTRRMAFLSRLQRKSGSGYLIAVVDPDMMAISKQTMSSGGFADVLVDFGPDHAVESLKRNGYFSRNHDTLGRDPRKLSNQVVREDAPDFKDEMSKDMLDYGVTSFKGGLTKWKDWEKDMFATFGKSDEAKTRMRAVWRHVKYLSEQGDDSSKARAERMVTAAGADKNKPSLASGGFWNKFEQFYADSTSEARVATELLASATGKKFEELKNTNLDIHMQINAMTRTNEYIKRSILDGVMNGDGKVISPGINRFKDALKDAKIDPLEYDRFRKALRHLEIGARRLDGDPLRPDATMNAAWEKIVDEFFDKHSEHVDKLHELSIQMYDAQLRLRERFGLELPGYAEKIRDENPHYWPLKEKATEQELLMQMLNPEGRVGSSDETIRAMGQNVEYFDGFTAYAMNLERTLREGLKNEAYMPFLIEAADEPLMASVVRFATEEEIMAGKAGEDKAVVKFYQDGQPIYFKLDPLLWDALRSVDPIVLRGWQKFKVTASKVFKGGTTTANPAFKVLINPLLDLGSAIVNHGFNPFGTTPAVNGNIAPRRSKSAIGKLLDTVANAPLALTNSKGGQRWTPTIIKALAHVAAGSRSDLFRQWVADFGTQNGRTYRDFEIQEMMFSKQGDVRGIREQSNQLYKIVEWGKDRWEGFEAFTNIFEDGVRMAMYMQDLGAGKDRKAASQAGADLMNFGRSGTMGRYMSRNGVPYAGIPVQAFYQLREGLKRNPMAWVVRALVVLPLLKLSEEVRYEGDEEYEKLPDYQKDRGLLFKNPAGGWIMLPMDNAIGALSLAIPRRLYAFAKGELSGVDTTTGSVKALSDAYVPQDLSVPAKVSLETGVFAGTGAVMDLRFGNMKSFPQDLANAKEETVDKAYWRMAKQQIGNVLGSLGRDSTQAVGYLIGKEENFPNPLSRYTPEPKDVRDAKKKPGGAVSPTIKGLLDSIKPPDPQSEIKKMMNSLSPSK